MNCCSKRKYKFYGKGFLIFLCGCFDCILSPVMLLIAAAIKLDTKGPIFTGRHV